MSAQWNLVLRMLVNRVNSQGLWTERQLRLDKSQRTNEVMRKMALDFTLQKYSVGYAIFHLSLRPIRAISSVGLEHLVYTEGVGSSSLSSPTKEKAPLQGLFS